MKLPEAGTYAHALRRRGCDTLRDAARLISELPYGRNSDRSDYRLVLTEGRGACSTKHALLAVLAREAGCRVDLVLGVYEMSEANTPGVGSALSVEGLHVIPEVHTYLRSGLDRIDVTRGGARLLDDDAFFHEEAIAPSQIGDYKEALHRRLLERWAASHPEIEHSPDQLWAIRERCIEAIAEDTRTKQSSDVHGNR